MSKRTGKFWWQEGVIFLICKYELAALKSVLIQIEILCCQNVFFPSNSMFCDILDKLHVQAFLYGYWSPERSFIKAVASLD